jgi:cobalt-zinc-cadmium efflux system outer membrane protein
MRLFLDRIGRREAAGVFAALAVFSLLLNPGLAQPPAQLPVPRSLPGSPQLAMPRTLPDAASFGEGKAELTLADAVRHALLHNPQLTAVRQQHGIAAAGLVIAKQYPFNPLYQAFVLGAGGPSQADIKNRVFNEHTMRLDLEVRGQGGYRKAMATAALTRVGWEIAAQEVFVAVGTIRAFQTVLYRDSKLKVLEETVRLNERTVEQVRRLVEAGKLRPADVILARTEVDAARAQLGQGRTARAVAVADLRRSLGILGDPYDLRGSLALPVVPSGPSALAETAVRQRPDVQARRLAIAEAEARYRLECANRYGNPSVGPAFEYNETRVTFVGLWLVTPLPVINTRRGEIMQRQAEVQRARLDLAQFEFQAQQDVEAALKRLADARAWANSYEKEVLPSLQRSRRELEKLFAAGDPSVDIVRLLDVQRKYLRAYDSSLDAQFEVSQASADLAAAVGDPSLAVGPGLHPAIPATHP